MAIEYYNRAGVRILADTGDDRDTTILWARMYEDNDYRVVKVTPLSEERRAYVSTIWLGFDMDPFNTGLPLIFETILFEKGEAGEPHRHATEQDAIDWHDYLVARWR